MYTFEKKTQPWKKPKKFGSRKQTQPNFAPKLNLLQVFFTRKLQNNFLWEKTEFCSQNSNFYLEKSMHRRLHAKKVYQLKACHNDTTSDFSRFDQYVELEYFCSFNTFPARVLISVYRQEIDNFRIYTLCLAAKKLLIR